MSEAEQSTNTTTTGKTWTKTSPTTPLHSSGRTTPIPNGNQSWFSNPTGTKVSSESWHHAWQRSITNPRLYWPNPTDLHPARHALCLVSICTKLLSPVKICLKTSAVTCTQLVWPWRLNMWMNLAAGLKNTLPNTLKKIRHILRLILMPSSNSRILHLNFSGCWNNSDLSDRATWNLFSNLKTCTTSAAADWWAKIRNTWNWSWPTAVLKM